MKLLPIVVTMGLAFMATGCATSGKSAAELSPGKFVTYNCDDKKSFQVRFNAEEGTARVRTHEGSAELNKGARGLYRDDEGQWILALGEGKNTELVFKSKTVYKNCSAAG